MTSARDRVERAAAILGDLAQRDVALAPLTTYRVGGCAALFARPRSVDDLSLISDALEVTLLPVLVVGRGSNLLVADDGFEGLAISLADMSAEHHIVGDQVLAGAMVALPQLARQLVAAGLTGFEWAVGVPGSVGGAVRMNAGGHGGDIATCLVEVQLFDLLRRRHGWLPASALGLRFRGSDLADHQVVIEARLQLARGDRDASERELAEVVRWRRERQPGGQNAGSVFINPVPGEVTAGELIDRSGLRGLSLGSATVSDKHANFIQGSEGGTAADVRALIDLVRDRVAADSGFVLRSEVRLVGFDDHETEPAKGVQW